MRAVQYREKSLYDSIRNYLFLSGGILIFSLIYEHFSHGVYSSYMLCAFMIPFVLGCAVNAVINLTGNEKRVGALSRDLRDMTMWTLLLGSIITGILEIYGTTNVLTKVFFPIGIILSILTVISIINDLKKPH